MQALTDPSILLRIAEKLLVFERPLLVTLPNGCADRLSRISKLRTVAPGAVIASAGTLPSKVILLIHGDAVIRIPGSQGASVKRILPGEILGIPESFCNSAADYDIVAVSDCSVSVLTAAKLERFLRGDQEARDGLIISMGKGTQALYRFARNADT